MVDSFEQPSFAELQHSFEKSKHSFAGPVRPPEFQVPAVHVSNLRKSYRKTRALQGISFSIRKGEIFGLLGSNGAGKSTAIKIIAGILRPSGGLVFIQGINVQDHPIKAKARLGYLPELPILYEHLTGREFLTMIGQLRGIDDHEIENIITRGVARLELVDFLDGQIGHYSKGMRQKIAFLMATIGTPPVLLLDEPSSGLDPRFNRIIKEWILELQEIHGLTVLLSTHMTDMAESLCDRIAIIDRGRIIATGEVQQILKSQGSRNLEEAFVTLIESVK